MDSKSQFRQTVSGFEASVGLGPIDRRRGGIVRAVVGLGKPIGLFRRLKEPPLTAEIKAPTLLAVASHRGTEISNPFPSSSESGELPYCAAGSSRSRRTPLQMRVGLATGLAISGSGRPLAHHSLQTTQLSVILREHLIGVP